MANKERMLLWAKALLSGEFKQGKQVLVQIDPQGQEFHCCLGVVCKVAIANGLSLRVEYEGGDRGGKVIAFGGAKNNAVLPQEVMDWLDIDEPNPSLRIEDRGWVAASGLNDAYDYDFEAIAKAIIRTYDLEELSCQ